VTELLCGLTQFVQTLGKPLTFLTRSSGIAVDVSEGRLWPH
jgi:hypothetical protein